MTSGTLRLHNGSAGDGSPGGARNTGTRIVPPGVVLVVLHCVLERLHVVLADVLVAVPMASEHCASGTVCLHMPRSGGNRRTTAPTEQATVYQRYVDVDVM